MYGAEPVAGIVDDDVTDRNGASGGGPLFRVLGNA
jgi:hypothetical protein